MLSLPPEPFLRTLEASQPLFFHPPEARDAAEKRVARALLCILYMCRRGEVMETYKEMVRLLRRVLLVGTYEPV